MMGTKLTFVTVLVLALAGCSQDSENVANRSVWVPDGPPVNCISISQLRTTRVIDDQTIEFEMTGRRMFRNNLPFRCSGLSFNRGIRHNSRTSQLCSFDTFTVNSLGTGPRGPTCRLGQFQPFKRGPVPTPPPAAD